jgi:flagellar basal body-associated protein FliL
VAGLVSIFAAAAIPIIVMGAVLEISKLIATVWLKINWSRAPTFIRTYLLIAIAILMLITSMGIFGFLSKAHSDAGLVSGDVQAKIAVYDEKIKTERENIDAARKALSQMDAQVNERLSRSTDDRGAERAVQIRRQQQAERSRLQNDISRSQGAIARLNEERAPIAAEVRKVEAEVGPIKYIANFIYGDNPDTNVLEKAVTWVIIIIVIVFDPLAVILLLASQYSFQWFRQAREEESAEGNSPIGPSENLSTTVTETPWPFMAVVPTEVQNVQTDRTTAEPIADPGQPVRHEPSLNLQPESLPNDESLGDQPRIEDDNEPVVRNDEVEQPQEQTQELTDPIVEKKDTELLVESRRLTEEELDELDQDDEWKEAKHAWKEANPNETLKRQKELYLAGTIDDLPWAEDVKKKKYIVKENAVQIQKTTKE